jgi:phenylacetate-coenzyme A ligase PaaK-like adenylate-forming protein
MNSSYNISLNREALLHADADNFETLALEVFRYQHDSNDIYRQYCDALHVVPTAVRSIEEIPFLPISFFKTHIVTTAPPVGNELIFESSGTTGESTSRHYVLDTTVYEQSLLLGFEQYYGKPADYAILALLPSYLERKNASLVYMAKTLMRESGAAANGFYINEWLQLAERIKNLEMDGQKVLLLGVTFALLDFAEAHPMALKHTIVMETGGMKGRKQEMTRDEVHDLLKKQWQLPVIHSEYGMTELLSQAYSLGEGVFRCTNTMKVLARDINDPLEMTTIGSGALNVIDLANVNSCSFLATEDLCQVAADGSFKVLGRMDHSILRGCSLMAL